jgi:hypothetical protein
VMTSSPVGVNPKASLLCIVERLATELWRYGQCWRVQGWEWWLKAHETRRPEGMEQELFRCVMRRLSAPQGFFRLVSSVEEPLSWEIRAVESDRSGISWEGPGHPKPVPQSGPHLEVKLAWPQVLPKPLLVVVGLGQMDASDWQQWRKQVQFGPHPHQSWIGAFRIDLDNPLNGEAQRTYGSRQLYVGGDPHRRLSESIKELIAHFLVYLWQGGVPQELLRPWLENYIRSVLQGISDIDASFFLENLVATFALPLHANGRRKHLRALRHAEFLNEGIDKRLDRNTVIADEHSDDDPEEVSATRGRQGQKRQWFSLGSEPQQSSSTWEVASTAGLTPRQVCRKSQTKGLRVGRQGPYVQYVPSAGETLRQEKLCKELHKALIYLRALLHQKEGEDITVMCQAGGGLHTSGLTDSARLGRPLRKFLAALKRPPTSGRSPMISCYNTYKHCLSSLARMCAGRRNTTNVPNHLRDEPYPLRRAQKFQMGELEREEEVRA